MNCACGERATWDAYVSGSAGGKSVRWRSCPRHPGNAIGRPVPTRVFERGRAAVAEYEEQRAGREDVVEAQKKAAAVDAAIAESSVEGHVVGTDDLVYRYRGALMTRREMERRLSCTTLGKWEVRAAAEGGAL